MIGKELGVSAVSQRDLLFPEMETFYYLEPTQKENNFELYVTHQNDEDSGKNFTMLVANIYQYETARVIMNKLNENLRNIKTEA